MESAARNEYALRRVAASTIKNIQGFPNLVKSLISYAAAPVFLMNILLTGRKNDQRLNSPSAKVVVADFTFNKRPNCECFCFLHIGARFRDCPRCSGDDSQHQAFFANGFLRIGTFPTAATLYPFYEGSAVYDQSSKHFYGSHFEFGSLKPIPVEHDNLRTSIT